MAEKKINKKRACRSDNSHRPCELMCLIASLQNPDYRKYRVIVKTKVNDRFQQRITTKIYDNSFFLL